jgi:hypothetical protein
LFSSFRDVKKIETGDIADLDSGAFAKFRGQARAAFEIELTTNYGTKYKVLVVVPKSYPMQAPAVYVMTHISGPNIIAHIYTDDGRCCLFEKYGRDWNPIECDLVTIVSWAAMWLFCQEYFQRNGRWPAPESHRTSLRPRSRPWDRRRRR